VSEELAARRTAQAQATQATTKKSCMSQRSQFGDYEVLGCRNCEGLPYCCCACPTTRFIGRSLNAYEQKDTAELMHQTLNRRFKDSLEYLAEQMDSWAAGKARGRRGR
jgi:sulfatase maturation enzyme AslB (radical SAM superfamily)